MRDVMDRHGLSERRACQLADLHRSVFQYEKRDGGDEALRSRLRELANELLTSLRRIHPCHEIENVTLRSTREAVENTLLRIEPARWVLVLVKRATDFHLILPILFDVEAMVRKYRQYIQVISDCLKFYPCHDCRLHS